MSVWTMFCLLVVVYFEREEINRVGRMICTRIKLEVIFWRIRRSIRKKAEEWR